MSEDSSKKKTDEYSQKEIKLKFMDNFVRYTYGANKNDLKEQMNSFKDKVGEYSRKDINLKFMDNFTRYIYTNPNLLAKVEFIQYIMLIALIYFYNPLSINTKFPVFTKLLVLIIAFVYVILFIFIKLKVEANQDVDLVGPTEKTVLIQLFSTLLFFFLFMLAIKGVLWLFMNTNLVNVFRRTMTIFIVIGVLGIVYMIMKKTINKAKNASGNGFLKLFLKVVMYLPCLMADIAEYIKFEFHLTTKPVWILCGFEAGLIAMFFIIPFLLDKIFNYSGLKLLREPVNLDVETTVGNLNVSRNPNDSKIPIDKLYSQMANAKAQAYAEARSQQEILNSLDNAEDTTSMYTDPNVPKNKYLAWIYNKIKNFTWLRINFSHHPQYTDFKENRFSYTYAISGWFYINPQPPNTRSAYSVYTNILKYGDKVKFEYNGKLNSLRVMAATSANIDASDNLLDASGNIPSTAIMTEVYQTNEVLYQKWNNIVINYTNGFLDVFLNGVLVSSRSAVMPYFSFDTIVVGAADGIMGGMCNVNYYREILTEKTIRLNYKTLRIKDVPYV
jgi:hypothetical protein